MNANVFVDTNVLVYSRDASEVDKQRQASDWLEALWRRGQGAISFQVLQEYYVTVTQKLDPGMSAADARSDIRALLTWNPLPPDNSLLESAWRIGDRFRVSWWDSLIIAAAQRAGARFLLTEDLQDEMVFEGVRVIHPFHWSYSDLD